MRRAKVHDIVVQAWPAVGRLPNPVLLRRGLPFLIALLLLYLARDGLAALDWRAMRAAAGAVGPGQWALSALATGVSFLALGRYDQVVHAALGTGIGPRRARCSGMAAIAIGQLTGAGLLTGTLTRWRLVPELALADAGRVTLTVTVSFLMSWAALTGAALLMFGPAVPGLTLCAGAGLGMVGVGLALSVLKPRLSFGPRQLELPPLRLSLRILMLSAVDTLAAGLALYVLLPETAQPAFLTFLPVFLLALGAGLCLGTPGGIGPFELTLVAFLPDLPVEPLAAALLCYRLLYVAAPALIAGLAILLAEPGEEAEPRRAGGPQPGFATACRAESNLFAQGQHDMFCLPWSPHHAWLCARAGQSQVALFDPARGTERLTELLPAFAARARDAGLIPCLYKITPRIAVAARRAGWRLHPVAEEFWLDPATFSLASPARSGLRRKLRQAERAGLRIEPLAPGQMAQAPWPLLADVNRAWAARHGGERGFSMGRHDATYLSGQQLWLAWRGPQLVAYVSFHAGVREWTLDLVRQTADAPEGAVASLISAAISDARAAGIARLSLAAATLPALGLSGIPGAVVSRLPGGDGASGLRRFKMQFAPERTRLYIAARSRPALLWSAAEIARAIRWPRPLPVRNWANSRAVQELPEKLAFEVS